MTSKISQLSALALSMMGKHRIPPTPENYAVWYHYALSENKELVREIDSIINTGAPFTNLRNEHLYKLVYQMQGHMIMESTAAAAQKLLSELLKVLHEFNSEASQHSKDIDKQVNRFAEKISDPTLKEMIKGILVSTAQLRDRSANLNNKLEESKKEVDTLRQNLQEITTESQRDFLTHTYNRKALNNMIGEQVAHAKSTLEPLCVLMVDIDHFKQFNDRFGHLLGDEVLKIVAKSLTDTIKGKDIVARFGGEEFCVLLPDTPVNGALIVAETIRKTIASKDIKRKDTGETYGTITVSVGVAQFRPELDTVASFIKRADDALYLSKREGRNRVTREAA